MGHRWTYIKVAAPRLLADWTTASTTAGILAATAIGLLAIAGAATDWNPHPLLIAAPAIIFVAWRGLIDLPASLWAALHANRDHRTASIRRAQLIEFVLAKSKNLQGGPINSSTAVPHQVDAFKEITVRVREHVAGDPDLEALLFDDHPGEDATHWSDIRTWVDRISVRLSQVPP